jgi:hypothetical protein
MRIKAIANEVAVMAFVICVSFVSSENVYCTYYRESNEITCGTVTCLTHVPPLSELEAEGLDVKLPRGWSVNML